jgi:hypothetical protein
MRQKKTKVKRVTKSYMENYGLTHEVFSEQITASLKNTKISRVSVTNWSNGKSSPSTDFLLVCLVAYKDWRYMWAMDCLKEKLPEVFSDGIFTFNLPYKI